MGKENPQRKTHLIFSRPQKTLKTFILHTRTSSMTTMTMNTFESDIVSDIDIFSEAVGVSATTTEIPSFWQMHMSELSESTVPRSPTEIRYTLTKTSQKIST